MSADVLVDKSGLIWGTESIVQKNYIPKVLRVIDSRASLYSSGVMGKAIWVVTSVSHPGWVAQKRSQVQWRSWVDGTRSAGMRIFVPEHLHQGIKSQYTISSGWMHLAPFFIGVNTRDTTYWDAKPSSRYWNGVTVEKGIMIRYENQKSILLLEKIWVMLCYEQSASLCRPVHIWRLHSIWHWIRPWWYNRSCATHGLAVK